MSEQEVVADVHGATPDADEEWTMSVGTPSEIARDPSRGFQQDETPIAEASTHESGGTTLAFIQQAELPRETVAGAMQWLEHGPTQSADELAGLDAVHQVEVATELRGMWGERFGPNLRAISRYIDEVLPPAAAAVLRNGRMPDGRALANDSAVLMRLHGLASAARPRASGSVDAQIREVEKLMKTNRRAYDRDEVMQARYRELLTLKINQEGQ